MKTGGSFCSAAFTLLELLIVVIVIAILATLLIPVISTMRARAQRAQCSANLRNLYVAAESYLQQNGSWPQIRVASDSDTADQDYGKAWIAALTPFGPTQKTWICPTIQESLQNPDLSKPENVRVDYYAMPFDDKPTTPHQWPTMPWFIEAGDVHGNGNLVIFTDGSISDSKTIAKNAAPAPTPTP
jgi:prepilin-type N-terminal cleavage/methylation domain-containing protein